MRTIKKGKNMKKVLLIGLIALSVAACNRDDRKCKTTLCEQCLDSCVVSCIEQAGASERARCEKSCQCACVKVEDGETLGAAIQKCI